MAVALAALEIIESILFGVGARDPLTFVTVSAALLTVSVFASLVPAIRTSRVDPVEALREE